MNVLLADRLVCARCGPPFGLVLLAGEVRDRRVLRGDLGCPNCRDRFPVADGFADLRAPPRGPLEEATDREASGDTREPEGRAGEASPDAREDLVRLAASLGVTDGAGHVLLVGPTAVHAEGVADLVPGLEVVAALAGARAWAERAGVTRLVTRPGLPFQDRTHRAVALSGNAAADLVEEAARVTVPGGRVVLPGASAATRERLEAAGLRVVAGDEGLLVTERSGPRRGSGGVPLPVV